MSKIIGMVLDLQNVIRQQVEELPKVTADVLGLDRRAGLSLYIDGVTIIVHKRNDKDLQYYGGFEYVEKTCRTECGDYVIYDSGDSRVWECIEAYEESIETVE